MSLIPDGRRVVRQTIIGASGVWTNVTPSNVSLDPNFGGTGANFGSEGVIKDPFRSGALYAEFNQQGVWKSVDFGASWTGPIDTPSNAQTLVGLAAGASGVIYGGGINGASVGFWKSTNSGVDWSSTNLIPPLPSGRNDVYAPQVDPYDSTHLLMSGHEQNFLLESTDAGASWASIAFNAGMNEVGGTAFCFFINTGTPSTTRATWLWTAQGSGGTYGTWRTTNSGSTWTKVDNNEHAHGAMQIYQPDTSGVVFMPGIYSTGGQGVQRSTDYGATWANVSGNASPATVVWGTPSRVYAMYSVADNSATPTLPLFRSAAAPATSGWSSGVTPDAAMTNGAQQVSVLTDGIRYVFLAACWCAGLWRYIE